MYPGGGVKGRLSRTRPELAAFLKCWRERTNPSSVGLIAKGRRKTPGLRREEVAALAGVGVTWYTWLEQGREIVVSDALLEKLCAIFKLGYWDRRYMYLLCQGRLPSEYDLAEPEPSGLLKAITHLVHDLNPRPTFVLDGHWMVPCWNAAAEDIFKFSEKDDSSRNLMRLAFLDPQLRAMYDPWPCQAQQMVEFFRKDVAKYGRDEIYSDLIEELGRLDPRFNQWWICHEPTSSWSSVRRFKMRSGDRKAYEYLVLMASSEHRLRIVSYSPCEN